MLSVMQKACQVVKSCPVQSGSRVIFPKVFRFETEPCKMCVLKGTYLARFVLSEF